MIRTRLWWRFVSSSARRFVADILPLPPLTLAMATVFTPSLLSDLLPFCRAVHTFVGEPEGQGRSPPALEERSICQVKCHDTPVFVAVLDRPILAMVLVAKSFPSSSNLFHKASKVRKRGGVWGNALQPVMHSADIHSSRGHHMLKMSPRLSNVTRPPQAHPPYALSMDSFDACSFRVLLLELVCLLSLTSSM